MPVLQRQVDRGAPVAIARGRAGPGVEQHSDNFQIPAPRRLVQSARPVDQCRERWIAHQVPPHKISRIPSSPACRCRTLAASPSGHRRARCRRRRPHAADRRSRASRRNAPSAAPCRPRTRGTTGRHLLRGADEPYRRARCGTRCRGVRDLLARCGRRNRQTRPVGRVPRAARPRGAGPERPVGIEPAVHTFDRSIPAAQNRSAS